MSAERSGSGRLKEQGTWGNRKYEGVGEGECSRGQGYQATQKNFQVVYLRQKFQAREEENKRDAERGKWEVNWMRALRALAALL